MAYVVGQIEKNSPLLSRRCLLVIANEVRQSPGEPTGRHCAHWVSLNRTCTLQGIAMTKDVSPARSILVIANEVRQPPGRPTGRHCAHRVSLRRTCTLQGIAMTNLLPTGRSLRRTCTLQGIAMTNEFGRDDDPFVIANEVRQSPGEPTGRHCAHRVSLSRTCTLQGIAMTNFLPRGRSLRRTCTLQGIAMTNLLPTGRHCAHWVSFRKNCTPQGIALTKNMSPASGLSCRWRDERCH
jgi:hypothetical protein